MAQETKLTAEGLKKLQAELDELVNVKRPEILERIKEARAQGDLSENAEYEQAREDQGFNEGRIKELEEMLKHAVVIEDNGSSDAINFGSTVVLEDMEFGDQDTYTIVGTAEADSFKGLISNDSPVGAAILGHHVNDVVDVNTPAGVLKYKIVEIKNKD